MSSYITYLYVYEEDIEGKYNTKPHEYEFETKEMPIEKIQEALFDICEIERIYSGYIYVEKQTCKDGNYVDSDESEFEVNINLSNELSEFFNWDVCRGTPPIYKIDREHSTIKMIV